MSFTDQKPHVVTEEAAKAPWSGGKGGKWFRCQLCGHRFEAGDTARFVFSRNGSGNFFTCVPCDGEDVAERVAKQWADSKRTHWWLWKMVDNE